MKLQQLDRPSLLNKNTLWGLFFLGAIALSFYTAEIFHQEIFNPGGIPLLWQFFRASLHPQLNPQFLLLTLKATVTTLTYAVCGTFLSLLLGIVGGIFSSQLWWQTVFSRWGKHQPVWLGIRFILSFPRAIHELIWGLFFVSIWGLDPLVAVWAIAIPYGAIVAKVFSEILDETPRQPLFALLNSGVSPLSAFIYSLIPQAFFNLLSYSFYRFECSIRSAAVLGIIGAGGLGYEILLSLQSLRYEQLWTFFYALVLLSGAVDVGSAWLRRRLGCASRLDLNLRKLSKGSKSTRRDPLVAATIIGIALLIPFCFWYINADWTKLWVPRTYLLLNNLAEQAFPLNLAEVQWQQLLKLCLQTGAMSLVAIALAGIGGILLSFPAAAKFFLPGGLFNPTRYGKHNGVVAWLTLLLTRSFLLFCRAIPAPIWALVALFVLFPGILPGAIALGIHNLGILARLMAEVNENLPKPPLEALKAQGTPAGQLFLYGVLPLTLPRFLAYILYRWEVCTRETVIVGLVGAGGLGRLLTEQLSSFDYGGVVITLGCFVGLTFLVDWISATVRQ